MPARPNLKIYSIYAPVYDRVFGGVLAAARRKAVGCLDLQAGERLLIPGIGTGLDLPLLPSGVRCVGFDISSEMLAQARSRAAGQLTRLACMDAQALAFEGEMFDAILFNLILSVAPDGGAAFQECWRVLKTGGRAVIFDKFIPERGPLTPGRKALSWLIRLLGTDPNRRLGEVLAGAPSLQIESDEPSLLNGQYRIVRLRKMVSQS